jgi:hypothetical protein
MSQPILEAFEKAMCSETSHFSDKDEDVSFWLDPTTCPDSGTQPIVVGSD